MTFEEDFPSLRNNDIMSRDKKLVEFMKKHFLDKQKVKEFLDLFVKYELTETDDSLRQVMMIDKDVFFKKLKELKI